MAAEYDLSRVISRLRRRCPDMLDEIEWLRASVEGAPRASRYVEVTRPGGKREVMTEEEYLRTAVTELAHTNLRYLTRAEVQQHGG